MVNIAVIGAGPAGLVAAKELIQKGLEVTLFEREQFAGGVFGAIADTESMWQIANLTSSKWITEFSDFPMPESYPEFPTIKQTGEYFDQYANAFNIRSRIRFGEEVTRVERIDRQKGFRVFTAQETHVFDKVVVSCGLHQTPNIPNIPGITDFSGRTIHASKVQYAEAYKDRNVLVVGLAESGVFFCSQVAPLARTVIASLANGANFAPRQVQGVPLDLTYMWELGKRVPGYTYFITLGTSFARYIPNFLHEAARHTSNLIPHWNGHCIPQWRRFDDDQSSYVIKTWWYDQDYETYYNDNIQNLVDRKLILPEGEIERFTATEVEFKNGSKYPIDDIVLCTGFTLDPPVELPFPGPIRHQQLFKGMFVPSEPDLALVGTVRPNLGSIPGMSEMQARYVAQIFSGEKTLPDQEVLEQIISRETEEHKRDFPIIDQRLPHVKEFRLFMDDMAKSVGCEMSLRDFWKTGIGWFAFFAGPHIPLRYRLSGNGSSTANIRLYEERCRQLWRSAPYRRQFWSVLSIALLFVAACLIPVLWFVLPYQGFVYYSSAVLGGILLFVLQFQVILYVLKWKRDKLRARVMSTDSERGKDDPGRAMADSSEEAVRE